MAARGRVLSLDDTQLPGPSRTELPAFGLRSQGALPDFRPDRLFVFRSDIFVWLVVRPLVRCKTSRWTVRRPTVVTLVFPGNTSRLSFVL